MVGFDPDPATLDAGGRAGRDRPRRRLGRRGLRGRRGRLLRGAGGRRCRSWRARRWRPAARTPSSPTSARPSASIVAALGDDERFIGGHPLAGAETAGVENAREDLFEGARWYLTPTERSSGVLYDRLQRDVAGARRAAAGDRRRGATTA